LKTVAKGHHAERRKKKDIYVFSSFFHMNRTNIKCEKEKKEEKR